MCNRIFSYTLIRGHIRIYGLTFAYKGWQHFHYVYSLPNRICITQLTGPRIIDAPLTLILNLGQGAARFLFCLYRMATLPVCVNSTKSRFSYPAYRTKNHWRSIDAHFATGISTLYHHFTWQNISSMVFWQPFYCLHVLSALSLHCSLIIHINRSFKSYYIVSGNCRY